MVETAIVYAEYGVQEGQAEIMLPVWEKGQAMAVALES